MRALRLEARAGDEGEARGALGLVERAALGALERAAGALGDEVVVIGRFSAALSLPAGEGGGASAERSLRRALEGRLIEAGRGAPSHARFASVAAAEAAYVGALLTGGEGVFPFSALGHLGRSPSEVLAKAAARGRLALADLLAALASSLSPAALARAVGPAEARLLLERLLADDAPVAMSPPPSSVLGQALSFGRSLGVAGEQRRCLLAARLYALWAPCRVVVLDPRWLDEPVPDGSREPPCDRPRAPVSGASTLSSALRSGSGGLLLWAMLLRGSGLEARLGEAYPSAAMRSSALHAIGRSLAGPGVSPADPLLSLWALGGWGEGAPGAGLLEALDPEPMVRAALGWASERGLLDRPLGLARLGDQMVATTPEQLVVDVVEGSSAEAAAPGVVARFLSRLGRPPPTLRVGAPHGSLLEAIAELDVPGLPSALRPAVLSFASCLRAVLSSRLGARPAITRGWPALVEPSRVLVRRSDLAPALRGARLPVRVPLGGRCLELVVS